jgi:hypothetical protein
MSKKTMQKQTRKVLGIALVVLSFLAMFFSAPDEIQTIHGTFRDEDAPLWVRIAIATTMLSGFGLLAWYEFGKKRFPRRRKVNHETRR